MTVVDTPGQGNFVLDTAFNLRGVGAMLLVLDPAAPIRAETFKVYGWAKKEGLAVLVFLNRMERPDVDVEAYLANLAGALEAKPVLLQLPIGSAEGFTGVVDVLSGKAHTFQGDGGKFQSGEVPADLAERLQGKSHTDLEVFFPEWDLCGMVLSNTLAKDGTRNAKEALEAAYSEASKRPGRVVLDFTGVDYINSTGIAVIVGLLAMARAEQREIHAFGLTEHYREVFTITRLADFMTIHDDEKAAVAAG